MALNDRSGGSGVDGIPADYFAPRVPATRIWLRTAAVVTVVAALVAAGVLMRDTLTGACGGLGSGLTRVDGECVGVSAEAAGHYFSDDLRSVQDAIARENDRVHREWQQDNRRRYVKVALLSPLTATETSFMTSNQILHAVQGAYVAQWRANHTQDLDDRSPLIQLVLASEGSRQAEWRRVVRQLEEMADDEHPLVAVIGMGTSIDATKAAAEYLSASASALPMVGAVTTADELRAIRGFVRVSPSDTDYVAALADYLKRRGRPPVGMLVHDTAEPDLYVRDLRKAYKEQLEAYLLDEEKSFSGAADPSKARPQMFNPVIEGICDRRPDLVLYAGRALDLDEFVAALAVRTCRDKPIEILVGATGLGGFERLRDTLVDGRITIVNAAAVDPRWFAGGGDPKSRPEHLPRFVTAFQEQVGGVEALTDGYAVVHHDAMATAVKAIRIAARPLLADQVPAAVDVRAQLANLNSGSIVRGAGGDLSFNSRRQADPVGKWVPVVTVPASSGGDRPAPIFVTR
ncbi:MAG TPA: hypothetical protein VGD43_10815 [Micromonospora sp.]